MKCARGNIDRAGGLVFGLKNAGNYFVLRINALEDNVILFEYVNGERFARITLRRPIRSDTWYRLSVEITKDRVQGRLDDTTVVDFRASAPPAGHIGLWTKADSVTYFDSFTVVSGNETRLIPF